MPGWQTNAAINLIATSLRLLDLCVLTPIAIVFSMLAFMDAGKIVLARRGTGDGNEAVTGDARKH